MGSEFPRTTLPKWSRASNGSSAPYDRIEKGMVAAIVGDGRADLINREVLISTAAHALID